MQKTAWAAPHPVCTVRGHSDIALTSSWQSTIGRNGTQEDGPHSVKAAKLFILRASVSLIHGVSVKV